MTQLLPPNVEQIATPILDSLKQSGLFQDAIAQAVADRVVETAQEMADSASQVIQGIDFTEEILRAYKQEGFSEELQGRLDAIGALGEVVSLRIQLALIVHANELKKLQDESVRVLEVEVEIKKNAIESRYELKRNFMLTRMGWILNIFSLWPVVCLAVVFSAAGFIGGLVVSKNFQNIQVVK